MGDIPNDIILRHVKNVMQRDRQFNHTQRRTKVTPRSGNSLDDLPSQFVCELWQFRVFETVHITGELDGVEEWFRGWSDVRWSGRVARVDGIVESC